MVLTREVLIVLGVLLAGARVVVNVAPPLLRIDNDGDARGYCRYEHYSPKQGKLFHVKFQKLETRVERVRLKSGV